ncbi:MAG: glycosyltransferase family 2 protein [Patescibacteria group bacterium]
MHILSIIIVTFSCADYLERCLRSVKDWLTGIDYQLIIVDNNSSDGTAEIIKRFPEVVLIQNNENRGFGAACNQGIRQASGSHVLLLNADTVIQKGNVRELLGLLQNIPSIGIIGGQLKNSDGSIQPSTGRFPSVTSLVFDKLPVINRVLPVYFQRRAGYYQKEQWPDWVAGSFFMINREVINKIGLFDESYFMYMEDVDYCYRARQAGWQVAYYPQAVITHFDLGKSEGKRYNKAIYQRLGLMRFFGKFYRPNKLVQLKKILRFELLLRKKLLSRSGLIEKYQKTLNATTP